MRNKTTLVIAFVITLLMSASSFAQIVTSGADDGTDGTLRNEIADTPMGGTITFMPTVTNVTLNGELIIDKDLTITGTPVLTVTIDANFNGRVFNIIAGHVSLNDLTITNGVAPNGGGIYMTNATVTINDCVISNNVANATGSPAGSGGGIFNDVGGILVVNDSEISSNMANRAGGGIEDKTAGGTTITTTLNNVSLLNNNAGVLPAIAAPGNGGGIHVSSNGSVTIIGGIASGNMSALEGGALWNGFGTMTVDAMTIEGNDAQGADGDNGGGGIFNNGGTLIVQNGTTITNNSASGTLGSGGGIFNLTPGTLSIDGLTIENNTANRAGGGIEINSAPGETYTFNDVNLLGNTVNGPAPGNGGGLHISGAGDVIYNGGTVSNNTAFEGGGLWNSVGEMTVNGTTITGNIANGNATGGGGLFNNGGILNVNASTILTGNIADASDVGGRGGAIFNNTSGTLNLASGLIISENYASRAGGAIEDSSGGTLVLDGVTLTSNAAGVDISLGNVINPNPGNGGAIHLSGTTNATINNSTITLNLAAAEGGGLWNNLGSMTVDNTLIDENDAQGSDADTGGGGIFNNGGALIVQNSTTVTNNLASGTSGSGGGIFSTDGNVTVNSSWVAYNTSNRAGGGIELIEGNLNLINTTLDFNTTGPSPGNGGGLHISGSADASILGGTVNSNIAASEGGGLWNGSGTMTVNNVMIDNNEAQGPAADNGGAGIFNNGGTLIVQNGTVITNNTATGTAGSGGGVQNVDGGSVSVSDSEISGNSSNRAGGGIEDNSSNGTGTITLFNVTLNNNTTGSAPGNGGGLHMTGPGNSTITGGTVNGNLAALEGGGLWNGSGTMTVELTTIDGNTASGAMANEGGGGIFNAGGTLIVLNGTTIINNVANGASGSGGGILNDLGTLTVTDSDIMGNSSVRAGGGIEDNSAPGGLLTITDTNLVNNTTGSNPGNGGGLHITGPGDSNITNGTVNSNSAGREGGGLWNGSGVMTLDNVSINANIALGNAADDGGAGIFNNGGTLNITNNSVVSNNLATGTSASGGGLLSTAGDVTVTNSIFEGNATNRAGGAIEIIDGNLTFINSLMSANDVNGLAGTAAPGNGGGLHITGMSGTVNISTSTIIGNAAANEGGGLWNQGGTTMNVLTSTINNNTAGEGGGVFGNTGAITTVLTSTISGNSASVSGGGIFNNGASFDVNASTIALNTSTGNGGGIDAVTNVSLKNTIVALNTASSGTDVSGLLSSNDYNLIGTDDLSVFAAQANDIEEADPLVGPLQDNGGTTFTHQLLNGSPAFDAGDSGDAFADQIGQPVFGTSRDIGAYESQVALSVDSFNQSAVLSVYPNPTKGAFNIELGTSITGDVNLKIISITGTLVKETMLKSGLNTIDINGMASGLYILNISSENNSVTHKLVLD